MIRLFPLIFIVLWSSAFITTKPIVDNSSPFAALCFRFFLVSCGFFLFVIYKKYKIITSKKNLFNSIISGILFHGIYLGGVFFSISKGLPTGIAALIVIFALIIQNIDKGMNIVTAINETFNLIRSISKVALLNIGSEDFKGNETIRSAYQKLNSNNNYDFEFKGYIEGNHIMDGDVNVIVTDGFTGNVALKTAEGTANFITKEIKKNMTSGILGKILTLLNYKNLMKFKKRLDPRLYNGAIFIGLNSPVIKSHGSTDHIGFSHSLNVCKKIVEGDLINKIKTNIK